MTPLDLQFLCIGGSAMCGNQDIGLQLFVIRNPYCNYLKNFMTF